jgi:hypothetical protein
MRYLCKVTVLPVLILTVWAHFGPPLQPIPVERLLANVQAYVESHPQDPYGLYRLGRIHYLAFAYNKETLRLSEDLRGGAHDSSHVVAVRAAAVADPVMRGADAREAHLREALRLFKKALEIEPRNGLFELGLGCAYEDGRIPQDNFEWQEQAISHYLAAYRASITTDLDRVTRPLEGLITLVSYEAGESYVRLVRQRGLKSVESSTVKLIETDLAAFRRLPPPQAITPIIMSLQTTTRLQELLAATQVKFDLDGTGRKQVYTWLRPDAAFLVWDPAHKGRVTSGRQLFGTVTWWMFWADGYQALAALDDDHDGWLSGRELAGIALWFDRNQNGVSETGEVIGIEDAGVDALAVFANGCDGQSPMNSHGARLKDGRLLPTWDWVTFAVSPTP